MLVKTTLGFAFSQVHIKDLCLSFSKRLYGKLMGAIVVNGTGNTVQ